MLTSHIGLIPLILTFDINADETIITMTDANGNDYTTFNVDTSDGQYIRYQNVVSMRKDAKSIIRSIQTTTQTYGICSLNIFTDSLRI